MTWQSTPYTLALILAAVISALLTVLMWQRRQAPGGALGAGVMAAVTIWTLAYALQVAGADLSTKLFWSKVRYLGIVSAPPFFLLFALDYSGHRNWFGPGRRWPLFIVPAITLLLAFTNEWHHQIWYQPRLETTGGINQLVSGEGAWFWLHTVYSYSFILGGIIILLHGAIHAGPLHRRQRLAVAIGSLVPLLANIVTLADLWEFGLPDITPFAFLVTGAAMAWDLFRYHLFDLVPIARELVFESMGDGVIVLDQQGRVVDANPAAHRIVGMTKQDLVGEPIGQIVPQWDLVAGQYTGEDAVSVDMTLGVSEPQRVYSVRVSPLRNARSGGDGCLVVLRDVSEQRQALAAIQRAREEAEAANRAKSSFLANMSHELRTPLTAIIGYSELIQEDASERGESKLYEDMTRIRSAGVHLLALVNTVLDFSKIEAGEMTLQVGRFDVVALIQSVTGILTPLVEQNDNRMIVEIGEGVTWMESDRMKVQQVLLNLLGNAVKFTQQGTITLSVTQERREEAEWLCIRVTDTGIGISPDVAQRLFQPFMQADSSSTRRYGGTGLGLAISHRFCQILGGVVRLEQSAPGAGTVFVVELPVRLSPTGELLGPAPVAAGVVNPLGEE